MKRQRGWGAGRGIVAFGMALGTAGAMAQVEEIIVTAQKRAENIQEVPIAIQALTGEKLSELGVTRADDLLNQFSNLSSITQSETNRNFFIRGVGTNDFHQNSVGAVGLYLDEVSITNPYAGAFSLFDMERIEVLRGPQIALFGRNTTGGAINYISRQPNVDDGINGYLTTTYGRYDQVDVEAGGGAPLGERVAIRAAAAWNQRDGVFDNITTGKDTGKRDRLAGRFQALWQATDALTVLGNVHGGVNRGEGRMSKIVGLLDPNQQYVDLTGDGRDSDGPGPDGTPIPCGLSREQFTVHNQVNCADQSGFVHQYDDWNDVFGGAPSREDIDSWGSSIRADWDIWSMTLTAISSYESLALVRQEDSDAAPNTIFQFYQENELDQWSHELRLASGSDQTIRWIAGMFYFFEESNYQTVVRRTPGGRQPGLIGRNGTFTVLPNTKVNQDNELYSLYGQFEWDMQEDITITYGVRWSHETKTGWNQAGVRCGGGAGGPPFCPVFGGSDMIGFSEIAAAPALVTLPIDRLDIQENITGHRFSFDWQATDNILAYAGISRGFKSGGFSLAALQALTGLGSQPVEPEFLWAYEIGAKSGWFDDSLQFNVSTFWYDWENLQAFEPLFDPLAGFAVPQLVNIPKSRIYGADFEATWAPGEGWLVQGSIGLLDTKITDPGNVVSVARGNKLTASPELTFNGLLRKEFQIGPGRLALQTTARFQDDVTYSIANDPALSENSIWIVGARGSYRFGGDEQYEVAVWGDNLTDEEYCMGGTSLEGLADSMQCNPSDGVVTYGVTVSVRYK